MLPWQINVEEITRFNQGDDAVLRHKSAFLPTLLLSLILPLTVQAQDTPHWVHYKLLTPNPTLPKKVVVLPVNVEVLEVTAGGVEETVPEWTAEASANITRSVSAAIKADASLEQVSMPRLSGELAEVVNEHMALYHLVISTASTNGWQHKVRHFDYSIGPGLAALQRKTGADAAVLVYGRDYVSTAGRKAKAVAGNLPIVNIFTGPPPELGHSFIHVGVVDLKTGDLLWMNSDYREDSTSLRDQQDSSRVVETVFAWYPGIESYRKVYVQ